MSGAAVDHSFDDDHAVLDDDFLNDGNEQRVPDKPGP